MAEFILGRIKFIYKGNWAGNGTQYFVDDVVTVNGKTYICVINHISAAAFATDSTANPPKWNLIADGSQWHGDWNTTTTYQLGDLVKYGGLVYQCTTAHTSAATSALGLEADQSKWAVFAQSPKWTGAWATGTRYKVYDVVSYGGIVYICNTAHTSDASAASGLEADLSKWDTFNAGITYLGTWSGSSVRYKQNDVVKYGADLWICTTFHTSSSTFDNTKWSIFVNGFQFENSWSNATAYQIGDIVTYGGYSYIAKQNHTGQTPSTATAYWDVYTTGFNFQGDWSSSTAYKVGSVVRLNGYTYLAITDNTNQVPPNNSYWSKLNSGFQWTNNAQTYTGVSATNVTVTNSLASGAQFTIVRSGTVYSVTVTSPGTNYTAGDTLKVLGSSLGGLSPVNDLTITVATVSTGGIATVTSSGISSTWTSGITYVLGDIVVFGANSYTCVSGHVADSSSRPDNDTSATYWNLLSAGAEVATLTTAGDTFYYGPNGPTRLPIGTDGQIMRVSNGYPVWESYGLINNLVYVGPTGTDTPYPNSGFSIDKPFKTIRYACKQIEDGYLNPNARQLIEKNKQFIMKEVNNYIAYKYAVSITAAASSDNSFTCVSTAVLNAGMPIKFSGTVGGVTAGTTYYVKTILSSTKFTISETYNGTIFALSPQTANMTGSFAYNTTSTEHDTGLIVDAVAFDLSHGGTLKTTTAATAYYTAAGTSYITNATGYGLTQFIDAQNYIVTLINNVVANTSPATNYQLLNGVTADLRIKQTVDTTLTAEAGVGTIVTNLVAIISNGLTAGSTAGIPTAISPSTTISVKTGTYQEVLPIVVPSYTAIVGDELRSTVVQPKAANALLVNDKAKTLNSLAKIKSLVPNIVGNFTASKTSGNTTTQQYQYYTIDSSIGTSVDANAATMTSILSTGLTAVPASYTITDPAQYDTGYYNARRLIVANTQFLKDEITAFMNTNYSSVWSGLSTQNKANCTRDIGYIVDALQFDLTYGGNLATVIAARSYYSNGTFVEASGEKTAAIAVQARLNAIISNIAQGIAITPSSGNTTTQVTSGTAGSSTAGTFAAARIAEIQATITTGTEPTTIAPSTTWVSANLMAAFNAVQSAKTTIRAAVINWINKNYPNLTYNQTTCSRDVGYMIDALCYDAIFGSNFLSCWNAMSYYRSLTSTGVVISNQLTATVNSVNELRMQIKTASGGTGVLTSNVNTMTSVLASGLTAVPAYNLPTPTGGSYGYTSGYYNAARLITANKQFLKDEVTAYMVANYSSLWTSLGTSGQAACTRDIGYIVDALNYDLTYGGNLATVIAARSYYSNGTFVEAAGEKTAAIAVQARLNAIISNIAQGIAITPSSGNTTTQVTSGTAGSSAAGTFAAARITEISNTINTGTSPTTITPDTSWVSSALTTAFTNVQNAKSNVQGEVLDWINQTYPDLYFNESTCSRDVGYIIDALMYDYIFGSNFLSCWNAMSYYRALTSTGVVTSYQLRQSMGTVAVTGVALKEIITGANSTVLGSFTAIENVQTSANTIYDIVANGLGTEPSFILPTPTGYNTSYLAGYGDGKAQVVQNYAFIKDDIGQYVSNNYNSVWTALGTDGQAKCKRDVGYILDAIQYDMTYGGNTQTLIVGSSYYQYYQLTFAASEKTAVLAAYAQLKTLISQIVLKSGVVAQSGNVTPWVTTGTAGSAGAATFAQARIQDIIDWINNGTANATIAPSITWTSNALQSSFAAVQAKRSEIQSDTVVWVKKFYQQIPFTEATCSRDAGLIVDAISYDMVFGSNFNAITAGRSYLRATTSDLVVYNNQKAAELGAINFIKYKVKNIAANGGVATIQTALDDTINSIKGGGTPRNSLPLPSTIATAYAASAVLLKDNKEFIREEIAFYLNVNYNSVWVGLSDAAKGTCTRDVNYIVDAICYDLIYGGSFATKQAGQAYYSFSTLEIAAGEKTAMLNALNRLSTIAQAIVQNSAVTPSTGNTVPQVFANGAQSIGSSTTATSVSNLVTIAYNIVNNGLTSGVPTVTITTIAGTNTFTTSSAHGLAVGDLVIPQSTANGLVSGTTYFVASTPLTTTFTLSATYGGSAITAFTNGTGLSIVAETTNEPGTAWVDAQLVTQYANLSSAKSTMQTSVASWIASNYPALVYNQSTCLRDVGLIIDAIGYDMMFNSNYRTVKAGTSYYRAQAALVVGAQKSATIESFKYLQTLMRSTVSSNATALARVNALMTVFLNILTNGVGETPETNGTVNYNNVVAIIKAAEILRANTDFLANEATAFITQSYGGTVSTVAAASNVITTGSAHNLLAGDPVVFTGTSAGGITVGTTYYVLSANLTATTFSITATQNSSTAVTLTDVGSPSLTVRYAYDAASCKRDMREYVSGAVYDVQYTGNYKGKRTAQLYVNAVNGSATENMFLVSNGSGLRNCTLNGLNGTLTVTNDYNTKRPTAGAYVALNPGFGPNDSNAWVTTRSHYSQNVTMFGTGCVGAKIDGALHAGGNRSMVKNDFTTILSDGIGVWCTGSNSLTELVSVFNYYGYAGYLAELGGKIRATNGNSSYGTYGVIAEGVDSYETPIYANLNNRGAQAQVSYVYTDATDQVLRLEYSNAGMNYTNVTPTISGAGYNAAAIGDEYRDYGVMETRLIDLNDGNGYGGAGYLTAANAAQLSQVGYITIAASDTQLSPAYVGMRVSITAGTGVGQTAAILTYNNGSKIAQVYKESFTNLTVTGTSTTNNLLTVASTATLYVGMPIYLGTAVGGLSANTLYYVISANFSATQFAVSTSSGGGAVTVTSNTSGQTVTLYAAGWDHVIPGKATVDSLDLTSTYIIEPRITYSAPGFTSTARTLASSATWNQVTYGAGYYVAIPTGSAATTYSADGKTWSAAGNLPSSTTWADVVYGGGQGAVATAIVGGLGGIGCTLSVTLGTGINSGQVVAVNVLTGGAGYLTAPSIIFTSATGSGATATAVVKDGAVVSVNVSIPGSGYVTPPTATARTDIITGFTINSWGFNYTSPPTVTVSGGGSSNQATGTAVLTNGGVSSITVGNSGGSGYTSQPTVTIVDSNAKFVAIPSTASGGTTVAAYSTKANIISAGAWSSSAAIPNGSYASVAYGSGYWVAVGGTATCATSVDGNTWVSKTIGTLGAGSYTSVAYGNGYFVAIATGSNVTTFSNTSGNSWTVGGVLPQSTTWTDIAYGNGRFVALASNGAVAYSIDNGTTWIAAPTSTGTTTSVLSSSYTWTDIQYGQGLFFAVASGSQVCATSPAGINWTVRATGMPSSSNWNSVAFGNPNSDPQWVAISNTSGTVAASIQTGATTQGRIKVTSSAINEIRIVEPGSGYPRGTVTATTATTNVITVNNTTNLVDSQPIEFVGASAGGLVANTTYYVIGSTIVAGSSFKVSATAGSSTPVVLSTATLTGTWTAGPIATQIDPNKTKTAATRVRVATGVLGNPSFSNRGNGNTTATASVSGDGYSDLYQASNFINVSSLFQTPTAGANVQFASIPNTWYKLVSVNNVLGIAGNYTATFQINPSLSVLLAPANGDLITTRLKYSQVRLTGHDFLYIGTGNYNQTNYPNVNVSTAITANQTNSSGGGRVFFTSTDQDGNFNVGNLFGVQQSTGTATLNASAFNLSGLQSLQLGTVAVGSGSATITSFSTDPYFTANSDNILPTQRAIKSYITAQIGGGQSSLNVNTLTSGVIYVANNTISTTNGTQINVKAKMYFSGGIDGAPVALGFFMQK